MADAKAEIERTLGLKSHGKSHRTKLLLAAGAVILLAAAWYLFETIRTSEAVKYTTTPVTRGGFVVTVNATGTVEPTNLVEISSELSGTLASVEVDFNDAVEVGTLLAKLDTTKLEAQVAIAKASLDAALARVAVARASLEDARQKYEIARDLDRQGFTSHQNFVTQQAAFKAAQAELQSVIADKSLAEANLDLFSAELEKASIYSPIKGVILDRSVDPGQIVAAALSAPVLFTVAEDLTQMELQVAIDEADIGRIAVGNSAEFSVDAYGDQRFPAQISEVRFAPETIDGVVTYKAILTIDNSDLLLRPGMTATADVTVAQISDALIVPNAALRFTPPQETSAQDSDERSGLLGMLIPERDNVVDRGNDRTLWLLDDGKAREITVKTGDSDGRFTEILDGPLTEGSIVITDQTGG